MTFPTTPTAAVPASVGPGTLCVLFQDSVARRGDQVIFRQKRFGIWEETTWHAFSQAARDVALGLIHLGFEPGETVSILANTCVEWAFADLGALTAGGICSGIYPTDAPSQVEYVLSDSQSVYVFVEDDEQLDKVLSVRERLPKLRRIIVFEMDNLAGFEDPMVMSLKQLRALGAALHTQQPDLWMARSAQRQPGDVAILVYTSGTTGRPKGAMLTHDNLVFAAEQMVDHIFHLQEGDERIGYLPLCHVAERVGGLYSALCAGTPVNFVEDPDAVAENLQEIQPTVMFGVPRIWEKLYSAIQIQLGEGTRLQRWAYQQAMKVGTRRAVRRSQGAALSWWDRLAYQLAFWTVFRNLRTAMGLRRCRVIASAAAPISVRLLEWYSALGIDVIESYGQTESTGMLSSTPQGAGRLGTVGKVLLGCEARLSEQGEILTRGRHVFSGYMNQPEATAQALAGGWLHTGDVGEFDADGYLRIKDRLKDIIITSGGKNITPTEIENELKFSPYVTDAVVIGDRRPYLVCLIMIDHENVEKYAQSNSIAFSDYSSLCRAPEILTLIESVVHTANTQFARVEQVKKFRLIERKLSVDDEELTPTMKLKRKLVNTKYESLINTMYGE